MWLIGPIDLAALSLQAAAWQLQTSVGNHREFHLYNGLKGKENPAKPLQQSFMVFTLCQGILLNARYLYRVLVSEIYNVHVTLPVSVFVLL